MKRRRKFPNRRWRQKKKEVKKRLLNMRNKELFIWDLNKILKDIPEQGMADTIAATIYSRASRLGIDEALDYVDAMLKEKALDEDNARRVGDLIIRNSMRR